MNARPPMRGYIALMATIIISMILLVMVGQEGFSGWHARFNVLGTESKEQANTLSEGCADQAMTSILTNPGYAGGVANILPSGTCRIAPLDFSDPSKVLIQAQAQVGGPGAGGTVYSNLGLLMNLANVYVGGAAADSTTGTVVVQTVVQSTTTMPENFSMHVSGVNPSRTAFPGSVSGVVVHVLAGAYSVTQDAVPGFKASRTADCAGTIQNGDVKICTFVNTAVTTTLTLVAQVLNQYEGTLQPTDFPMFIDGVPAAFGQAYEVTPGTHTASAPVPGGYIDSPWGYQCDGGGNVTLQAGDNKVCMIEFDDLEPPSPSCADTVMMLDRSGSMFTDSKWIADEKTAAKKLVDLYSGVVPSPKIGAGRFGGILSSNTKSADIFKPLSDAYASLKSAIDSALPQNPTGYTNLSAALSVGAAELNGPAHDPDKEKVLILISDGDPNEPSTATPAATEYRAPSVNARNASGDEWSSPASAYDLGGGEAYDTVSENDRHRYQSFNFPSLPSGSEVTGIEVLADAWITGGGGSPVTVFSDGFGTGSDTNSVGTGWSESGSNDSSNGTILKASGSGNNSASPDGGRFALIEGSGGYICRTVNTSGQVSPKLSYYWRGDTDASSSSDVGVVEYRTSGSCTSTSGWTAPSAGNHRLNTSTGSWTGNSIDLPVNSTVIIRFRSGSNSSKESFRVDGVAVTAQPAASTCQLGVDLSWNGGSSWTSEKTAVPTGSKATYTFGGSSGSSSDRWGRTWSLSDFSTSNFRARIHAIDPGAGCTGTEVERVDYLRARINYTATVSPSDAALNAADTAKRDGTNIFTIHFGDAGSGNKNQSFLASLASGLSPVAGHEPGSANDKGGIVSGSKNVSATAYLSPNQWTTPQYGYSSGSSNYATSKASGNAQKYGNFAFTGGNTIPPDASVKGIELTLQAKAPASSSSCKLEVALSSDGGQTFSSAVSVSPGSTSTKSLTFPSSNGSTNTWGRTWTPADFEPGSFVVRVKDARTSGCSSNGTFSFNQLKARVYYSSNPENADNDHFFIAPTSADMPAIFDYIGNQVCPAARPSAILPPTDAQLIVITRVVNNDAGTAAPSQFQTTVSSDGQAAVVIPGADAPGTPVTLPPGAYSVTEAAVAGYTASFGEGCSADSGSAISEGETRVCIIVNDDLPPPPPIAITPGSWQEVPSTAGH